MAFRMCGSKTCWRNSRRSDASLPSTPTSPWYSSFFSATHTCIYIYIYIHTHMRTHTHTHTQDTEFPGVVARPVGEFKNNSDFQFQLLRCNVDLLKIIQVWCHVCVTGCHVMLCLVLCWCVMS